MTRLVKGEAAMTNQVCDIAKVRKAFNKVYLSLRHPTTAGLWEGRLKPGRNGELLKFHPAVSHSLVTSERCWQLSVWHDIYVK